MKRHSYNRHSAGLIQTFYSISVSLLMITGCGKPDPAERYVRPEQVTDFHRLFGHNCSGCHGMDGQLGPAPPLNDLIFQSIVSDDTLRDVITHGREGTQMPAFGTASGGALTEEQVTALVNGIRTQWGGRRSERSRHPSYAVGETDDPAGLANADVENGKMVFDAACASCHGDDGRGGKDAGAISVAALGSLMSDQLTRRLIITGRPDLGMPDYARMGENSSLQRALTAEEITNVTAFTRSLQQSESSRAKGNE